MEPSKRTIRSYLLEEWLPENQPPRLRPSSYANYMIYTRTHVVPRLGDIELQRLTPPTSAASTAPSHRRPARRPGPLAPKTVRNIHAMLHRALKDAVRPRLPGPQRGRRCHPAAGASPEMQVWTPSSCAPSWPTLATIACTPCGCWSPPPGCAAPSSPGSAGSTST